MQDKIVSTIKIMQKPYKKTILILYEMLDNTKFTFFLKNGYKCPTKIIAIIPQARE